MSASATPLAAPDQWDARPDASATCEYTERPRGRLEGMYLDFTVAMRGFGSQQDRPGQGLLDNMHARDSGALDVLEWRADPRVEAGANATFSLVPASYTLQGVEKALAAASGGKVLIACVMRARRNVV
ncbi:MAG: hypothetical protein M1832_004976 [Thelocarpon impressellum]|nr:MAG: hypothetical protein M1832_004976 [Thelocarpon impressellum]